MIQEKIKDEDWQLYEIVRNPALFGEFFKNIDIEDEENIFSYSDYQTEFLCDFHNYVSLCCGRAVGKTESITDYILWLLVNHLFDTYILYIVPNKVHLEPVFNRLVNFLRRNTFLSNFIEVNKGINSSNNTISLVNGAQLVCRIAGTSGTGANVIGLHTPIIIVDESGYFPWGTWLELQPVLNTFTTGHKMWVSGVPTGLRENNVCYLADEVDPSYSRYRISSHKNPRYSAADEVRNVAQYGGVDSDDYSHFVLGRHGSPTFAVFDRRLMKILDYPVYKSTINGIEIREIEEIYRRLSLLPPIPDHNIAIMGIDLGYTDPTSIIIMYEKSGIIKEHVRIILNKVKYPFQEKIIDFLDTKFENPSVIGIDSGNEQGVIQHLLFDESYMHKDYSKRMIPIKFGAWMSLGTNADGEEIKVKVKPQSVSLLQEYSNTHRIVYSSTDNDLITELERMTYSKSPNGDIVYKTLTPGGGQRGDDHNTSAILCAMMSYFLLVDNLSFTKPMKRLAMSRWVTR